MESLLNTDETTRERWRRALDLVESASEMPTPERAAWLARTCGNDVRLTATVRELLAAATSAEGEGFMEQPPWSYEPPDDDADRLVGQQLGVWRLTRFVKEGGMGRVYLAERTDYLFNRQVAIKVIRKNLSEQIYQRFYREVRILGALQHPNLVFLYDAGRTDDGQPYLVMEYLPGPDLRAWLTERGALPTEQILDLTRQICAGLHAAHQAGVIHRDLKPGNLIVTEEANGKLALKLLDFGLAYRHPPQAFDTALTETHQQLGTPAYMAPEQIRGVPHEQLTPATDLYALGLIVYEMLTGRHAFLSRTREEIKADHLRQTPTPPSAARPDLLIPQAVDQVVLKVLTKESANRYQSAPEFLAALETAFQTPATQTTVKRWALAALGVGLVAVIGWFGWRSTVLSAPVASVPQIQSELLPKPTVEGLRINLGIRKPQGLKFDGCRFALLKPAVSASAPITSENTLVLLEEVNAQGTSKIIKEDRVPPGQYAMRFECRGFQTVNKQVTLTETQRRPGWATVEFDLKPE